MSVSCARFGVVPEWSAVNRRPLGTLIGVQKGPL
jgi:hypothetical protein